jgi:hypothetical protein
MVRCAAGGGRANLIPHHSDRLWLRVRRFPYMVFRLPDPSDSAGLPSEKTQVREIRRCEGQSCWRWRATSARRPSSPRGTRDDLEALDHQTSAVAHKSRKIRPDLCRTDDVSPSSPPPPLRLNLPPRLTGAADGLGSIWSGDRQAKQRCPGSSALLP